MQKLEQSFKKKDFIYSSLVDLKRANEKVISILEKVKGDDDINPHTVEGILSEKKFINKEIKRLIQIKMGVI